MNRGFSIGARHLGAASVAAATVVLTACGGGGDNPSPPPPVSQSLSGVVIDGPIQGATVCLDLNKNGNCDAGEPVSSATDAQGNYTITGLTTAQATGDAPLVAVIPATATDGGVAVGTAYKMSAPAGKPAVISPITTLVQTGVVQGMARSDAEAAVAAQLQVAAGSLYNNYTGSSAGDNASLGTIVPTVVASLQAGETPVVDPATSGSPGYWVRAFSFTDTNNYYLRYYYNSGVPNAQGVYTYYDERRQLLGGSPLASSSLYDTALYATPQGWKTFNGATPNSSTGGSPYVSTWGLGYTYTSTRTETDVSGQSMASVVAMAQNMSTNSFSTLAGVNASTLTGTMPAGARVRKVKTVGVSTPVAYRTSDGFLTPTTLAGAIAAFPVPSAATPSNTVSMGSLNGTNGCSPTVCTQGWMRAAFGASNAATYYLCDFVIATGAQSNCTAAGTGTYSIGTAADGSTPIMKFAGLPAAAQVQTFTRVFVERNGHVYYGWQEKPTVSLQTRLNKPAFEALAAVLGITPPTIGDAASVYAGTWSASYAGVDSGSCASVYIDATGYLNGSCASTGVGGSFIVSGHVNSAGVASFTASGSTTSGATFSGSFTSTAGSGSWTWPSHGTGTWTASKP